MGNRSRETIGFIWGEMTVYDNIVVWQSIGMCLMIVANPDREWYRGSKRITESGNLYCKDRFFYQLSLDRVMASCWSGRLDQGQFAHRNEVTT